MVGNISRTAQHWRCSGLITVAQSYAPVAAQEQFSLSLPMASWHLLRAGGLAIRPKAVVPYMKKGEEALGACQSQQACQHFCMHGTLRC